MANNTPRASELTNVSDFVRAQLQRHEAQLAANINTQPAPSQVPQAQRNVASTEQKSLPKPNRRSGISREKPSKKGLSAEDIAKLPESVRNSIRDQLREQSATLSPSLRKIFAVVKDGEEDKKKMRADAASRSAEAAEYAASNNTKLNNVVNEQKKTVGLLRELLTTVKNTRAADRDGNGGQRSVIRRALDYVLRRSISAAPAAAGFSMLMLAGAQRQSEIEAAQRLDINTPDLPLPPPPPPEEEQLPLPPPPAPPPPAEEQSTPATESTVVDPLTGAVISGQQTNTPPPAATPVPTPTPAPIPERSYVAPGDEESRPVRGPEARRQAAERAAQAERVNDAEPVTPQAPAAAPTPQREGFFSRIRRLYTGPLDRRDESPTQPPAARPPVNMPGPTPQPIRPVSQAPMMTATPASFSGTNQRDDVTPNFMNRVMTLRAREIRFKAEEFKFEQTGMATATPTGGSPIVNASFQTPAPMMPGGGGGGQPPQGGGALGAPLASITPTSSFRGPNRSNHEGIDLAAPIGTPVYATHSGTVTRADSSTSYGLVVYILGDDGTETRYAHLSQIMVARGARVERGQVIGLTGNSGRVMGPTGAHLHYEVRRNGQPVDPATTLPSLRGTDQRQAGGEPATPVDREQPGQQASPPAATMQPPTVQTGQVLEQNSRNEMIQNISMPVVTQPQENAQVDDAANPSVGVQTGGRWDQNTPGAVEPPDSRELYDDLFSVAI